MCRVKAGARATIAAMEDEKSVGPVRVLIVDDEENQRQALASMVSAWGYQAETAADGLDALDKHQTCRQ